MPATMSPTAQIMEVLARSNGRLLEERVHDCSDLTWNQVFLELDRLGLTGGIRLRLKGPCKYAVTAVGREGAVAGQH